MGRGCKEGGQKPASLLGDCQKAAVLEPESQESRVQPSTHGSGFAKRWPPPHQSKATEPSRLAASAVTLAFYLHAELGAEPLRVRKKASDVFDPKAPACSSAPASSRSTQHPSCEPWLGKQIPAKRPQESPAVACAQTHPWPQLGLEATLLQAPIANHAPHPKRRLTQSRAPPRGFPLCPF